MAALGAILFLAVPSIFAEDPAPAKEEAAASPVAVADSAVSTAQTPAATPAPAQTTAAKETASTPKLPYGVEDVLKLSRAQVSEDLTLSFIQSSGTIYDLRPNVIVYLKEQGVSDKVINAMIDQRKKAMEAAVAAQAVASDAVAQSAAAADMAGPVVTAALAPYVEAPPLYDYAEPTVDYVPASTLYVISYPAAAYAYHSYSTPSYGYGSYGYGYCGSYRYCGRGYCAPSTVYRFGCGPRGYARSCFRR